MHDEHDMRFRTLAFDGGSNEAQPPAVEIVRDDRPPRFLTIDNLPVWYVPASENTPVPYAATTRGAADPEITSTHPHLPGGSPACLNAARFRPTSVVERRHLPMRGRSRERRAGACRTRGSRRSSARSRAGPGDADSDPPGVKLPPARRETAGAAR
jgi:hypothetical protein